MPNLEYGACAVRFCFFVVVANGRACMMSAPNHGVFCLANEIGVVERNHGPK